MTFFDSVIINCPRCSWRIPFLSIAGECKQAKYSILDAPEVILRSLNGQKQECIKCENTIKIITRTHIDLEVIQKEPKQSRPPQASKPRTIYPQNNWGYPLP